MLNVATETVITIPQAAKRIPGRADRPTNISTVWRWIVRGARGPGGTRVRLRAARCGGRWLTSHEAVQEFMDQLTPRLDSETAEVRTRTQRESAAERAGRKLDELGM